MEASNVHPVVLQQAAPRGVAVVRARLPASHIAAHFRTYLDQVYAAGRAGIVQLDGQNIFVYREAEGAQGQVDAEFGVGVAAPFAAAGNVVYAMTPGGEVATTTHWGDYRTLGNAHAAVVAWCRTHEVPLAGPSWEVYGHWREGAIARTDIYYLVAPRR
jgi:effector-binding domain-containing protein